MRTLPGESFRRKQAWPQTISNISEPSGLKRNIPQEIENENFCVYRAVYGKSMGPVRLNEEQVNEQWLGEEELAAIYRNKRERISAPLLMTCEHILGFENERERDDDRPPDLFRSKEARASYRVFWLFYAGGYAAVSKEEIARLQKRIAELGYRLASDHQTQPGVLEREAKMEPRYRSPGAGRNPGEMENRGIPARCASAGRAAHATPRPVVSSRFPPPRTPGPPGRCPPEPPSSSRADPHLFLPANEGGPTMSADEVKLVLNTTCLEHLICVDPIGDALEGLPPRSCTMNRPVTKRKVASLMTTELASATPCRRAATFMVCPKASLSPGSSPPVSPTTTDPEWMPMRTESLTPYRCSNLPFRSSDRRGFSALL